ncbi:hypothetical protein AMAG_09617 [Allomyces macrogynus ATCC 38327]|uniref:Nuclear transport factor 2 n=1 Tax=Allomyces macrogynus (strain ATCC 38327) TaxID=578462 RepID=A0A0L0SJM4_ALLM3|nr:hypothetical protein AMAG_07874 [Allomyces macrogynus ATCC 38327]KNE65634.1 hypothetical protein AMAG_09617 [Allomyces macrogynus ATCC 38327]|eukprot:KNE62682.1 hypothetical protein AMAG_07874 [Allomyces macrogynus ATCC 38327]
MAADPKAVAKAFTDWYYAAFAANRASLAGVYRDISMLSFEGTDHVGTSAIVAKLQSLAFQQIQFKVLSLDAQPSNPQLGSILICVTGQLIPEGENKPLFFSQTFQLIPEGGSFWVYNDVFRLNYG